MLDTVLIALIFVALLPYIFGPIAVRFDQRWPARPRFEPYDPILHPLPDDLAAAFRESVDALLRSGMRLIGDFAYASQMSKMQVRAALLVDAEGREHALVIGGRSTNPKAKITACHVEFTTKFSEHEVLTVNNSTQPEIYPQPPGRVLERFPQVRDPARLRRVHAALLEHNYAGRARMPLDATSDPASYISAAATREYDLQVQTGYMWLDDDPEAYRPTWRGAWAMSFRILPPMRQIIERRRRRRAAALLEALGQTAPDERPVIAPATSDRLVWNLVLVAAMAVLYVLVRNAGGGMGASAAFNVPAGFTVPADFTGAVRALERLAGDSARPLRGLNERGDSQATGGFVVRSRTGPAIVAAVQDSFLARGFYLFLTDRDFGTGLGDKVALFPRRDAYEILRAVGTNGWNYDIGPDSIVGWLRNLEREQPFVLTGIGFDWVEGRFLGEIRYPVSLANRFNDFCPDIVDQGVGSVEELARELRRSSTLYCWWD